MSDETDTTPEPQDPVALRARVDQLERQAADYKALIADFDNARKRLTQDADRQRRYAVEPLAKDLLAGLDNLDRAVQAATRAGESGPLVQGVTATVTLFQDALKRHGVRRVDVGPGSAFDPHVHQAVMQQPTNDHAPGTVVQVVQPGYLLHDRVLRPASVVVASEPPAGGSSE